MNKDHRKNLIEMNEEAFNQMYVVNTLINMTLQSCEEKENHGEYYGLTGELLKKISDERNDYINMLTVLSDKIDYVMSLYLSIEKELTL